MYHFVRYITAEICINDSFKIYAPSRQHLQIQLLPSAADLLYSTGISSQACQVSSTPTTGDILYKQLTNITNVMGPDFRTFLRWRASIKFDFTCIIISVFCLKNAENNEKIKWKLFSKLISHNISKSNR